MLTVRPAWQRCPRRMFTGANLPSRMTVASIASSLAAGQPMGLMVTLSTVRWAKQPIMARHRAASGPQLVHLFSRLRIIQMAVLLRLF